jgi:vacuolar-type H+-ATPase subunit I/STV1
MNIKDNGTIVEFNFRDGNSININANKFSYFKLDGDLCERIDIYFKIENDKQIKELYNHKDIENISLFTDNGSILKVIPNWYDEAGNNVYQMVKSVTFPSESIEISISKDNYIYKEIEDVEKEMENLDNKLKLLHEKLDKLNQ